ncbi:MAG: hypothetical protein R3C28_08510 [Pirellulaceae bacterium]
MSTVTGKTESSHFGHYVDQQIEQTRRRVRWIDITHELLTMMIGICACFLVIAVIDHWILGLGFWARLLSLLLLAGGGLVWIVWRVIPLMIRPINPLFAAKAIEKTQPSLKNSVLNFLFLRSETNRVRPMVMEAVSKRAAADLSSVTPELAVDQSHVIRLGYVLAALVTVAGLYAIFSPKSPLQTAARIAMPWRDLARPARVEFVSIEPGNTRIYRGDGIQLTARLSGLGSQETVSAFFSTDDGQAVSQEVALQLSETGWTGRIPGQQEAFYSSGTYWLQAGDARSKEFRFEAVDEPSVHVERIELDYPQYTRLESETLVGQPDIRALEGTRVTIHALANQPIASAYMELDSPSQGDQPAQSRPLRMTHDGQSAQASFTLELEADRITPKFVAYRIRFSNENGDRNASPTVHRIEVVPDLAPLVEFLEPAKMDSSVAVNQPLKFRLRALDPDFAIKRLRLQGVANGITLLDEKLLDAEVTGQHVAEFSVVPERLGLRPGTTFTCWASVEDNRTARQGLANAANTARTENYRIKITPAVELDPNATPAEDQPNDQDDSSSANQNQNRQDDAADSASGDQTAGTEGAADGSAGQGGAEGAEGAQSNEGAEGQNQNTGQNSGDASSNQDDNSGDGSADASDSANFGNSDSGNSNQPNGQQQREPGDSQRSDNAGADGQTGPNDQPQDGGQPNGEPVASDGTEDGEAFDRILDHMKRNGQDPNSANNSDTTETADKSADASDSSDGGEGTENQDSNSSPSPDEGSSNSNSGSSEKTPGSEQSDRNPSDQNRTQDEVNEANDAADADQSPSGTGQDSQPRGSDNGANERANDGANERADGDAESSDRELDPDKHAAGTDEPVDAKNLDPSRQSEDANSQVATDEASDNAEATDKNPGNSSGRSNSDATSDRKPTDQDPDSPEDGSGGQPQDSSTKNDTEANADNQASENAEGSPSNRSSNKSPRSAANSDEPNAEPSETPPGGVTGDGAESAFQEGGIGPDSTAEDANLEYARRASNLALDYLKDANRRNDLKDELGWSDDEMKAFMDRWQQMQQASQQNDGNGRQARRELSDALRSLGLQPGDAKTRKTVARPDSGGSVRDGGRRTQPPSEYRDWYRAFMRSADDATRSKP